MLDCQTHIHTHADRRTDRRTHTHSRALSGQWYMFVDVCI